MVPGFTLQEEHSLLTGPKIVLVVLWTKIKTGNYYKTIYGLARIEGRILPRESSQGESSGLRVRLEGSLKTHYDVYFASG